MNVVLELRVGQVEAFFRVDYDRPAELVLTVDDELELRPGVVVDVDCEFSHAGIPP